MKSTLTIGEASKASGVHAKMIRHYESIGLVPKAKRSDSGYRVYGEADVHTLKFVRHARELGFSMKEIKTLLSLWRNRSRASSEVKKLALKHIGELEEKIRELERMKTSLQQLARHCQGDDRPDCPILSELAGAR